MCNLRIISPLKIHTPQNNIEPGGQGGVTFMSIHISVMFVFMLATCDNLSFHSSPLFFNAPTQSKPTELFMPHTLGNEHKPRFKPDKNQKYEEAPSKRGTCKDPFRTLIARRNRHVRPLLRLFFIKCPVQMRCCLLGRIINGDPFLSMHKNVGRGTTAVQLPYYCRTTAVQLPLVFTQLPSTQ